MSPRQALQFLSGPCMASLRFQHILIDVYLLCKARRLFKFTLLPTPFITLPKVWALDRWAWESEETFWRRRQTSSPGSRKLSSWFCSSLVLPAALRCGKSQSQIKRSNICQGVQFTEQIESCLQLTHATPRIHLRQCFREIGRFTFKVTLSAKRRHYV